MNWQQVESDVTKLASRVSPKPDSIVAIVRGGLVPARLLASRLVVSDMYCLTVKKEGSTRRVVTEIREELSGKSVLLVEDMLESGRSLIAAMQYLESLGATVQTLALYASPASAITPDYYVSVQEKLPEFPWE